MRADPSSRASHSSSAQAPTQRNRDLSDQQQMTAEAYIRRLAERGIDYVFANAGTDFAPIETVQAVLR